MWSSPTTPSPSTCRAVEPNKPGRPQRPPWVHLMAMRKRKTLVVCETCHQDIPG
ncbi:MAG: hypothetical protein ACRDRS_21745 [Pseudonocardiaceae bacterium]